MQRLYAILLWVAVILVAVAVVSVLVVVNDEFYPLISRRSKSVAASVLTTATMRTLKPAKVDPATLKDLSEGQKTLLKKLERAAGITGAVLGGAWAVASAVASVGLLAIYGREVQQATVETARILRFEIQNLIIDPKKNNTAGNEPGEKPGDNPPDGAPSDPNVLDYYYRELQQIATKAIQETVFVKFEEYTKLPETQRKDLLNRLGVLSKNLEKLASMSEEADPRQYEAYANNRDKIMSEITDRYGEVVSPLGEAEA